MDKLDYRKSAPSSPKSGNELVIDKINEIVEDRNKIWDWINKNELHHYGVQEIDMSKVKTTSDFRPGWKKEFEAIFKDYSTPVHDGVKFIENLLKEVIDEALVDWGEEGERKQTLKKKYL